jgi:hypothetical protein
VVLNKTRGSQEPVSNGWISVILFFVKKFDPGCKKSLKIPEE